MQTKMNQRISFIYFLYRTSDGSTSVWHSYIMKVIEVYEGYSFTPQAQSILRSFLTYEVKFTFDSTVNIVCGMNASGKSNVYTAFCHIFTDMYDKQPMTERIRTIFDYGKDDSEARITF
uniref:SMC_N domain-containing protein n=1 Tax=Strongyloides venezuelensis TaxID=75913 RepID=A0A0K0FKM3_STRVS